MLALGRASRRRTAITALLALAGIAAHAAVPARVARIEDAARVTLPGSLPPRTATDLGLAPADRQLSLSLRFAMSATQQASLGKLLGDLQDPTSPRYHQWLTPQQFGDQFGIASADAARLSAWLEAQGFTVSGLLPGGQALGFAGTVAQAQTAFSTQLHHVVVNGVDHIANVTAPSLPATIAAVTLGIGGLDDFTATPRTLSSHIADVARPSFTSSSTGKHYIVPGDIYTIYDETPALASNVTGSGVKIAVLTQSNIHLADIAAFRAAAGLTANVPTVNLYSGDPGFPNAADVFEAEMATEWAGATAPSASMVVVATPNVFSSLIAAVTNNVAPVIADSYGVCEPSLGASNIAFYNNILAQAAAQGITVVAPSGDTGATDCDYGTTVATHGLAVQFPGSSPYVTAVGATQFLDTIGNYWNSTNAANGSSAVSYIPEAAMNQNISGTLFATGGGASAYFPKPSWQQGTGVPVDAARDLPDVAVTASSNFDQHIVCAPGDCTTGFYNGTAVDTAAGTEIAAPQFAGFLALIVQKQGRIGVANNTLYALAKSYPAIFHDITSGNNTGPCTIATPNCSTGTLGYTAGAGYDQTTGLGSVDVFNLVNNWPLVTPFATTPAGTVASATNLIASTSKVVAGIPITLTATVSSASTASTSTPTGIVQFTVDSVAVGSAAALAAGTASYTLSTAAITPGTHIVQASYFGDTTFSGSRGAFSVEISSSSAPDFSITPANASVTVASGGVANGITFTITPLNGFTGDVSLTATLPTGLIATQAFNNTPVHVTGTAPQTTTLTLLAFQYASFNQPHHLLPPTAKGIGGTIVFAGVLCIFIPYRRKVGALLMFTLTLGAISLCGCTGNNPAVTKRVQNNTPAGTYNITVLATGSVNGTAVTHSSTVTFVVQ